LKDYVLHYEFVVVMFDSHFYGCNLCIQLFDLLIGLALEASPIVNPPRFTPVRPSASFINAVFSRRWCIQHQRVLFKSMIFKTSSFKACFKAKKCSLGRSLRKL
jgi:hypothetical protein